MRLSPAQIVALRLGAALSVVAAVPLAVVAVTVDTGPTTASDLTSVETPSAISLPDPGLFGADVVLYGDVERGGVSAADLGCRLLSRQGSELSSAKLSHLSVLGGAPVVFDGTELRPLFTVGTYPPGAEIACTDTDMVAPLALAAPSTFGAASGVVRATAVGGVVVFLGVGLAGGFALWPRRR